MRREWLGISKGVLSLLLEIPPFVLSPRLKI
jgi:hypothetical protein